MKNLILIVLSTLCLSSAAFATTVIRVQCGCSFIEDFIFHEALANGQRINPSADEISDCVIENGKVIEGCFAAKMNAQFNCQQMAQARQPELIIPPPVTIREDQCYGRISDEAKP